MKPVCCILLFSLLWFCSGCGTEANKPSPAEIKRAEQSLLQQELQHLIHRAEQKKHYAFCLQIQNPKQKEEYKGMQNGENCVILDAQGTKSWKEKKKRFGHSFRKKGRNDTGTSRIGFAERPFAVYRTGLWRD